VGGDRLMPPEFTIDHKDFDRAAHALLDQNFKRLAASAINPAMRQSANLVRKNVRAALRPHNRTGRMRDHVKVRVQGSGLAMTAGIRTTGSGSNLVIGGAKPHPIAPGGDTIMPIWGGRKKGAGIEGFARSVMHPGFRGDPFFKRGVLASAAGINQNVQVAAEKMATLLADAMRKG
jgi:hypothetical protein